MPEFKTDAAAFKAYRNKIQIRTIVFVGAGLLLFFFISLYLPAFQNASGSYTHLIALPVVAIVYLIMFNRQLKKSMAMLESFTLVITDNMVIREMDGHAMLGIYLKDIQSISKTRKGYSIHGGSISETIYVPAFIGDDAGVRAALSAIRPIDGGESIRSQQVYHWSVVLLVLAAMGASFLFSNTWVVTGCVIFYTSVTIYGIYKARQNKNLPENTRKVLWWGLLPLLSIAVNALMQCWLAQ